MKLGGRHSIFAVTCKFPPACDVLTGFWYVAVPTSDGDNVTTSMTNSTIARTAFVKGEPLPPDDMVRMQSDN